MESKIEDLEKSITQLAADVADLSRSIDGLTDRLEPFLELDQYKNETTVFERLAEQMKELTRELRAK